MSENHMNESGMAGSSGEVCLDVQDLKMHFKLKSGLFSKPKILKAVDGVSFSIGKGETMGLVGESGCGKTTVGRSILRLYEATDGKIIFQGTDITHFTDAQMLPYRKKMQMIFQDPYTSLDPRKNIGDIIEEPMWALKLYEGKDRRDRDGNDTGKKGRSLWGRGYTVGSSRGQRWFAWRFLESGFKRRRQGFRSSMRTGLRTGATGNFCFAMIREISPWIRRKSSCFMTICSSFIPTADCR